MKTKLRSIYLRYLFFLTLPYFFDSEIFYKSKYLHFKSLRIGSAFQDAPCLFFWDITNTLKV